MNQDPEDSLITWSVPQCPFTIDCSAAVLDEIRLAVMDAFFSLPRGGAEIGGLLLGRYTGGRLSVTGFRALECEHAFGPSFTLSERDCARLRDMLAEQARPGQAQTVGWYHSHTRSEIFLSGVDQEIHGRYFAEPWQVALVLRPHTFHPTRAGFFFREADGLIHAEQTYQEIQISARPLGPLTPASPTPPPAPQPAAFTPVPAAMVVETPIAVLPEAPAAVLPDTPTARMPQAPASVVPEAPVAALPDTPVAMVPDASAAMVPDTPAALLPEAPVAALTAAPIAALPVPLAPQPPEPKDPVALEAAAHSPLALASPAGPRDTEETSTLLPDNSLPRFLAVEPPLRRRPRQIVWVSIVLAVLAAGGYFARAFWWDETAGFVQSALGGGRTPALGLRVQDANGQLQIQWDVHSRALHSPRGARLTITDGPKVRPIPLDLAHLASGALTYGRESGRVDVTLAITENSGQIVREQTTFLGAPLVTADIGAASDPGMQDENDKLKLALAKERERSKKLDQQVRYLKDQLERELRSKRLEKQSPDK